MNNDSFNLDRFVQAQEPIYQNVIFELQNERKQTHWMWFIFPQLRALGRSSTAQFYGIQNLDEAREYWNHPILGARLRECFHLLYQARSTSALEMLGEIDALKLRSCLTLFQQVETTNDEIQNLLLRFYHGSPDDATLDSLKVNKTNT